MQIPSPNIKLGLPNMKLGRKHGRSGPDVVGLDIQPGLVAAVQARVNGAILAQRAAVLPLPADIVREGEVADADVLSEVLRELFHDSGLSKRVRLGVANQRTVLRTLELPPLSDGGELNAAVRFQAQDQLPMPLNNAVLDFHPLGIVDTPAGPRQRVVLVAAQRDMIERLLSAVRQAGLQPEGVDLSAFALIRSLHRAGDAEDDRVLYLNVDGLTNLAIAEGTICRFTRVVGSGLEGMASELAERRSIALTEARALLGAVDLNSPVPLEPGQAPPPEAVSDRDVRVPAVEVPESSSDQRARELSMSYAEMSTADQAEDGQESPEFSQARLDADVWRVLENGIREISGEVRNSLDFYRSQDGGGEVSRVVLSGSALDISGFTDALQASLGVEVQGASVELADERLAEQVATHRLAVATGLAAMEAPR
jgi:type IV pilus assembly protein PilM